METIGNRVILYENKLLFKWNIILKVDRNYDIRINADIEIVNKFQNEILECNILLYQFRYCETFHPTIQ